MNKIETLVTGPIGVNTYIVPIDDKTVFITDPGGEAEKLKTIITEKKVIVKAILLTHGHFDHILGLKQIKESFPEAFIMIHAADAVYLGAGAISRHERDLRNLGLESLASNYSMLPDADVFLNADDEPIPGWTVIHTPGHTKGSICLYNKARGELLSGDTLFDGSYGRTDLDGGSPLDMANSLNSLSSLPDDTKVYPGHGSATTIASSGLKTFF